MITFKSDNSLGFYTVKISKNEEELGLIFSTTLYGYGVMIQNKVYNQYFRELKEAKQFVVESIE
jgi:hypothetical protein